MTRRTVDIGAVTDDELLSLEPHHREPLVRLASGESYAQIAEALHRPVGTVRSRLNRARARLLKLREAARHEERGAR